MSKRRHVICALLLVLFVGCASSQAVTPDSMAKQGIGSPAARLPPEQGVQHLVSRFQLVGGPQSDLFLLDTVTGCVWRQTQHPAKRVSFVEVDVENLHWSWGSGAQQILSARIDQTDLSNEQKGALRGTLQKTSCGHFNVIAVPSLNPSKEQDSGEKSPPLQQPSLLP